MENMVWNEFKKRAAICLDQDAIVDCHGVMKYGQLQARAESWAAQIQLHEPEDALIGIMLEHSADQIAAMLGAFAVGCGYIPIEPDFPQQRIESMLADGRVKTVVTQERYAHRFNGRTVLCPEKLSGQAVELRRLKNCGKNNVAYVLFTSGTTGSPKGVMVSHKNLLHYARAFQQEFCLTAEDRVLQMSVVNFDIYVEEIYPALLNGSCVCILPSELRNNVRGIVDYCIRNRVTIISSFPYFLQSLNRSGLCPESVRVLISGGDVLHEHYVDKLLRHTPVYNTYGPTETTVCAAYYQCKPGSRFWGKSIPIGRPVCGANLEIVDEELKTLGPNQLGEICISGDGVSLGYLNRPEETARNFIADPTAPGQQRYLSGDIGYQNEKGEFVFVCRRDGQVMIQGQRVECMEVESVLNRCPYIIQAVVKAVQDRQGYPHLVAFLHMEHNAELSKIREYLDGYLLEYMIPEHFVLCDRFPITSSGKLDRKALRFELPA